jgi:MoaA/NifB/PqqE/SkfB family radical SAM enzyme
MFAASNQREAVPRAGRDQVPRGRASTGPLFVAINQVCNLRCWYCTAFGENRSGGEPLPVEELLVVIERAHAQGVRVFRFTGGEPTLAPDLGDLLKATQALGDDVRIALTTNGIRLRPLIPALAELRDPRVFVSVDGLHGRHRTAEDAPARTSGKTLTPRLARVMLEAKAVAHVRVNFVLTRSNKAQLDGLMDWVISHGLDLKVFELLLRDFAFDDKEQDPESAFLSEFVSVRTLIPEFERRFGAASPFAGTGGRGIPMRAFRVGESKIIVFDSAGGSHYGAPCRSCPRFPCQEGLYALILDADGSLHPAGCENERLRRPLGGHSPSEVDDAFEELLKEVAAADFDPVAPAVLSAAIRAGI